MDTDTLTREQIIRARSRREKRERWAHVRKLILSQGVADWLQWWSEHWPPDKRDMQYVGIRDSASMRRHVRIEIYYLQLPVERQEALEAIIWGE